MNDDKIDIVKQQEYINKQNQSSKDEFKKYLLQNTASEWYEIVNPPPKPKKKNIFRRLVDFIRR